MISTHQISVDASKCAAPVPLVRAAADACDYALAGSDRGGTLALAVRAASPAHAMALAARMLERIGK